MRARLCTQPACSAFLHEPLTVHVAVQHAKNTSSEEEDHYSRQAQQGGMGGMGSTGGQGQQAQLGGNTGACLDAVLHLLLQS